MSEHPITERMLETNGLRCACAEKPIELCRELEELCGKLAGALRDAHRELTHGNSNAGTRAEVSVSTGAALAEFDRVSRSSQ